MKRSLLTLSILAALGLGACSSTKVADVSDGSKIAPGAQQSISEQRLQSDFKRQGVRVIYSLTGNLEALEVTAYAPVWGNSENAAREAFRAAELEACMTRSDGVRPPEIKKRIQKLMWDHVGLVRSGPKLTETLAAFRQLQIGRAHV